MREWWHGKYRDMPTMQECKKLAGKAREKKMLSLSIRVVSERITAASIAI